MQSFGGPFPGDFGGNAHRGARWHSMQSFGGPFQVILAGKLTGVQGDPCNGRHFACFTNNF